MEREQTGTRTRAPHPRAAPAAPLPTPRPAPGDLEDLETLRAAALAAYGVLGEEHASRADLRALVSLAAAACGVPMATLTLLTEDAQHQVESVGFEGAVTPRSSSMCAVVVDEPEPVVLPDARLDPRFADNPWVTGDAGVRFYATFQLRTPADVAIGSLCVFDPEPRDLDAAQQARLRALAEQVVDVLELELKARRLRADVAELEATQQRLTQTNARLASFASTVAHDLRNPLTTLELALGFAGDALAAAPDPPARARQMVERAQRGCRRMSQTVDRMLSGVDDLATDLEAVSLDRVLDEVLEDLGRALVGVHLDVAAPLPWVQGDATGLRLVLQNLLVNAAKYAALDDPRVSVGAARHGDWWEVRVVDHGPGIPAADRERVLVRRERGAGVGTTVGSGIGLATCRQVVHQHGGSLAVEDTPGGGATFVLRLPALAT